MRYWCVCNFSMLFLSTLSSISVSPLPFYRFTSVELPSLPSLLPLYPSSLLFLSLFLLIISWFSLLPPLDHFFSFYFPYSLVFLPSNLIFPMSIFPSFISLSFLWSHRVFPPSLLSLPLSSPLSWFIPLPLFVFPHCVPSTSCSALSPNSLLPLW